MKEVSLTIAGSDSCSGAGIQADLKTFCSHGVHGLNIVTAVVAESPHSVESIFPIPSVEVSAQIKAVIDCYPIKSLKLGMLGNPKLALAIYKHLLKQPLSHTSIVIDPILSASTGTELSSESLIKIYKEKLFPIATIVTPNIPEAEKIIERKLHNQDEVKNAALELHQEFGCAVLLKGGHGSSESHCTDFLAFQNSIQVFTYQKQSIPMAHGTGCSLSAAIAANLAKGESVSSAVKNAGLWLQNVIKNSFKWKHNNHVTYCLDQLQKPIQN